MSCVFRKAEINLRIRVHTVEALAATRNITACNIQIRRSANFTPTLDSYHAHTVMLLFIIKAVCFVPMYHTWSMASGSSHPDLIHFLVSILTSNFEFPLTMYAAHAANSCQERDFQFRQYTWAESWFWNRTHCCLIESFSIINILATF